MKYQSHSLIVRRSRNKIYGRLLYLETKTIIFGSTSWYILNVTPFPVPLVIHCTLQKSEKIRRKIRFFAREKVYTVHLSGKSANWKISIKKKNNFSKLRFLFWRKFISKYNSIMYLGNRILGIGVLYHKTYENCTIKTRKMFV